MVQSYFLLGYATAVAGQFSFVHTQYETSPPVYPSRESLAFLICALTDFSF
jgi:hypothetical protein